MNNPFSHYESNLYIAMFAILIIPTPLSKIYRFEMYLNSKMSCSTHQGLIQKSIIDNKCSYYATTHSYNSVVSQIHCIKIKDMTSKVLIDVSRKA